MLSFHDYPKFTNRMPLIAAFPEEIFNKFCLQEVEAGSTKNVFTLSYCIF